MLKKVLVFLGMFFLFVVSQVSEGFAGGYEFGGLGTKALSMGGAFIGEASDWTAVYWNPAGLAQLKGREVGLAFDCPFLKVKDGDSVPNPLQPDMNKDQEDPFFQLPPLLGYEEPSKFKKKELTTSVYLPGLGGYTSWKDFTIGVAIYVPLGYYTDWKDKVSYVDASYKTKIWLKIYNISIAKQIIPNLSMGVGLNLLEGYFGRWADKTYIKPTSDPNAPNYFFKSEIEGTGTGIEGIMGLLFKPNPKFSIGLVYRSGSKVTFDGSAQVRHTAIPNPLNPLDPPLGINEESDYKQKFNHPATYGIGLAYRATSKFIITLDCVRTDWTSMKKDIDFDKEGLFLKDTPEEEKDLDWKATVRSRIGVEFKPYEALSLRAGFFLDPTPVPDKAVSLTNIVDTDVKFLVFGVGYKLENWQFDAGYTYAFGEREVEGVKYEDEGRGFLLTTSYRF